MHDCNACFLQYISLVHCGPPLSFLYNHPLFTFLSYLLRNLLSFLPSSKFNALSKPTPSNYFTSRACFLSLPTPSSFQVTLHSASSLRVVKGVLFAFMDKFVGSLKRSVKSCNIYHGSRFFFALSSTVEFWVKHCRMERSPKCISGLRRLTAFSVLCGSATPTKTVISFSLTVERPFNTLCLSSGDSVANDTDYANMVEVKSTHGSRLHDSKR